MSARTICRRLLDMGYKSDTTKSKPFPKPKRKNEPPSFAKEHQNWLSKWNNIIWADEVHFEVFNGKNHTFVRRLKSESN